MTLRVFLEKSCTFQLCTSHKSLAADIKKAIGPATVSMNPVDPCNFQQLFVSGPDGPEKFMRCLGKCCPHTCNLHWCSLWRSGTKHALRVNYIYFCTWKMPNPWDGKQKNAFHNTRIEFATFQGSKIRLSKVAFFIPPGEFLKGPDAANEV